MEKIVKAKYKNGVIEPMKSLEIPDDTEITITVNMPSVLSEEEKWNSFLSAAGSWKDIVDEDFLDEIYRQRELHTRPIDIGN